MRVESAHIKGYRLFEDETISFDESTTIIVGRNNSGKTSFVELFYKFFGSGKPAKFSVDDFSRKQYRSLQEAADAWQQSRNSADGEPQDTLASLENEAFGKLPEITLEIEFSYNDDESATPLADLILDLDPERHDALLSCRYYIEKPLNFLKEFNKSKYDDILEFTRRRMHYFTCEYTAIDKKDHNNYRPLRINDVSKALSCNFIYAQTLFDDTALDTGHGLSKGFEKYYRTIADDEITINQLEDAIQKVSEQLNKEYAELFKSVFKDLTNFGVDGMSPLQTVTVTSSFSPEALVHNSTRVVYEDEVGHFLPEAHNGLGFTKLIYIVLQFVSFFEEYSHKKPTPGTHLLFIEEPEAHLHPQMQSVFIRSVADYIKSKHWDAQLVITTHSSHIIAESGFEGIRYFSPSKKTLSDNSCWELKDDITTQIKNLAKFRDDLQDNNNSDTLNFLEQYMELRKCDMFFADKIILVEGTTERLLLPKMIEEASSSLAYEYISIIEVGGAYAFRFRELFHFLEVPTLIITDIDSGERKGKHKKCPASTPDAITTNATLKQWIPGEHEIAALLKKTELDKVDSCEYIRVAYQIPEDGFVSTGRSFEEAFILANAKIFEDQASMLTSEKAFRSDRSNHYTKAEIIDGSYEIAESIDSKSDFAFDILTLHEWEIPKYIKEGLSWLASASQSK